MVGEGESIVRTVCHISLLPITVMDAAQQTLSELMCAALARYHGRERKGRY